MSGKTATHAGLWLYMLVQCFLVISSAAKQLTLGKPGNLAYVAAGVVAIPAISYLYTLLAYIIGYWRPKERCSNRLRWDVHTFFFMGALQLLMITFASTGFFMDQESVRKDAVVHSTTLTTAIIMYMLSLDMIYALPLDAYPLAAFRMMTAAVPDQRYQQIF